MNHRKLSKARDAVVYLRGQCTDLRGHNGRGHRMIGVPLKDGEALLWLLDQYEALAQGVQELAAVAHPAAPARPAKPAERAARGKPPSPPEPPDPVGLRPGPQIL